ncbi:hypothetical protein RND71_008166 [Anisodus tanguticus]|uniref:NB-ARC domain-containing protein n=1 Tax=Anisodus tanguticus TaxID=243964 RepID=A0AAE1SP34_9SOLA|nr:hypothetical protein RND71_008166 [Anisodus tanguticus]
MNLKDIGEKIAQKCDGLPLVLDLIGVVIARKEKKRALWLEVLNNLKSFNFKDEDEVMKVIQLSRSMFHTMRRVFIVSAIRDQTTTGLFSRKDLFCFPILDVLDELEELRVYVSWDSFSEYTHGFPSSLKKLELKGLTLTSDSLSRIARLPTFKSCV